MDVFHYYSTLFYHTTLIQAPHNNRDRGSHTEGNYPGSDREVGDEAGVAQLEARARVGVVGR